MVSEETLAFCFQVPQPDGTEKTISVDPFRAERLLSLALGGEPLHAVIEQSKSPITNLAAEAMEKLLVAIQRAFGIAPLGPDRAGLNEKGQIRVLREFLRWKTELKKNTAPTATSPPPTASGPWPFQQKPVTPCGCSEAAPNSSVRPH